VGIDRGAYSNDPGVSRQNAQGVQLMARYLARACPRCNGYVGIVVRESGRNTRLQAVNGQCFGCGSRMAWIVVDVKIISSL